MDANGETIAAKEDAYVHEGIKSPASKLANDLGLDDLPKANEANTDSQSADKEEDCDDLLEKIEEAVKDELVATTVENDISKSSQQDFLKKIEEIENDSAKENSQVTGAVAEKEITDKVVVGKLVIDVGCNDPKSSHHISEKPVEAKEVLVNKMEETEPSPAADVEINIESNSKEGTSNDDLIEESELCISKSKQAALEVKTHESKDKTEMKNDALVTKDDLEGQASSSTTKEVCESTLEEESQKNEVERNMSSVKEKAENKGVEATQGNAGEASPLEENLTIVIEDSSEEKIVVASEETQKEDEKTVDLTEEGSSENTCIEDENKTACKDSGKKIDGEDVIKIDSTVKEKVHSENTKGTENVKGESMSVDIIDITDEPMEVDGETKTDMDVDNVETISDQDEEMIELKGKDEIEISSDSENDNSKTINAQKEKESIEPEKSCQNEGKSPERPCSISVKSPESEKIQGQVSTTKDKEANIEPIEKTTPAQDISPPETLQLTENEQSKIIGQSGQSTENESLSLTNEIDENKAVESLPEESPIQQKVKDKLSLSIVSSTTEEISSPKKDNQKVERNLNEAPKDSVAMDAEEMPDEKQNHLSDSTASLSSNAEEQIVQFGKETTIPAVEITSKIENKVLMSIKQHEDSSASLNTTPVSTLNVFNSTPIQKQFEISSENVSKISEATESSRTEKINEEEAVALKMPLNTSKPEETSETGTCSTSETEQQSSDGVAKYINVIKKYNGITDTTDDESTSDIKNRRGFGIFLSDAIAPDKNAKKDNVYEINLWYESNDIKFLSVERLDFKKVSTHLHDKTSEYSEQGSSNGSLGSLPPFTLPASRLSEMSSSVSSSTISQKTIDDKLSSQAQTRKSKHTIQGISELCTFMIQEFTKIKKSLEITETTTLSATNKEDPTTPKTFHKEVTKKNLNKGKSESPSVSDALSTPVKTDKRSRKRSLNKSPSDDEDDSGKTKPKKSKKNQSKSQGTPSKEIEEADSNLSGQCVLAKWVDKKYYAGRITGQKPGNKFVVLFADGASKTLPKESIVFGDEHSLPLKNHSIHALVDDDYECGIVTSVDRMDDKTIYVVKAETKTVKVTESDIYLQEDQAKAIQNSKVAQKNIPAATVDEDIISESAAGSARSKRNKRAPASPVTPEPGFSGGVGKKSGKKQKSGKIVTPLNRISESSDLSDTQDPTPASPERGLETVEGVQPETQRTVKEIEISKSLTIADLTKENPNFNAQDVLGPLPILKTLFKNKYFLLTCTIGVRPHRYIQIDASNVNNRNRQFSKVPFVKSVLQKQLEEGGAKVYQHFEDVPKTKYKLCKLIAPRPCATAKYVQCLAADIQAISHEWVIDSCKLNSSADIKKYILPSGWSILYKKYIQWAIGKSSEQRLSKTPFSKAYILIASQQKEFSEFWSRVCKLAGGTIRYITSLNDITPSTTGYMVTDSDFPLAIRSKAEHFGIPIVSTVWVVQSLILGRICLPNANLDLCQPFQDDDL